MDLANVWQENIYFPHVRKAERADAAAITRLLRQAPFMHMHADWRLPGDWLGSPGFVVLPEEDSARSLLFTQESLRGCLIATADPPPAAWVRAAVVTESQEMLAALLAQAVAALRETAVTELCWLATREWPNTWLPDLGFYQVNAIETYVKEDDWLPEDTAVPHLTIRPAELADMPTLEKIDHAAFAPMWRHSAETFALAGQQALCFDVAEIAGEIVGFQLSSRTNFGAHLVRLTIDPQVQRQGVGSAILAHAIRTYQQHGLRHASLNTQLDNGSSQFLYKKFGFRPTGQTFPVWSYTL